MNRLSGKVVLVTGSGRGFGKSLAIAFASEGARVVNIADPFRPVEVGHHIPPVPKGRDAIWTSDVFVDDRGLVYIIDRLNRGLDILEYTGPR